MGILEGQQGKDGMGWMRGMGWEGAGGDTGWKGRVEDLAYDKDQTCWGW